MQTNNWHETFYLTCEKCNKILVDKNSKIVYNNTISKLCQVSISQGWKEIKDKFYCPECK